MIIKFSKLTKINFLLAFIFVLFAFLYPYFIEKVFYSSKSIEASSIAKIVEKKQKMYYLKNNKYISLKKGDINSLVKKFDLSFNDIKYYDYSIATSFDSFTLYAQPKISYLKQRDISAKTYQFFKKLNQPATSVWK